MIRHTKLLALLLVAVLLLVACGGDATPEPTQAVSPTEPAVEEPTEEMEEPTEEAEPTEEMEEPTEEAEPTEEMEEPTEEAGAGGDVVFFSTQFVPVEEQETF